MQRIARFFRQTLFVLALAGPVAAHAQVAQDVPREHWAYEYVQDLASKGLLKGYPPQGNFFGKRTVTRYELATIVQRALARVDELLAKKADKGETAPPPPVGITPEQLAEVRNLVDEFKVELTVIGADLKKAQADIEQIKSQMGSIQEEQKRQAQDIADAKQGIQGVITSVDEQAKRIDAVNKTLSSHKIGGYLQARFDAFDQGRTSLFTPTGAGGTGQTPTTGAPAVGGPWYGFQARRARLKLTGNMTARTDYGVQIDVPSSGAFNLKDAFINIAHIPFKRMDLTAGQFLTPFGFELNYSSADREAPERSVGFSDSNGSSLIFKTSQSATGGMGTTGSVIPLFLNQEYEAGLMLTYYPRYAEKTDASVANDKKTKFQLAALNGEGTVAGGIRNQNNGMDVVARAQTSFLGHKLGFGVSGYAGSMAVRGGPPAGGPPAVPVAFVNAVRLLGGVDVSYTTPWKTVLRGEYVAGVQETTPDRSQYLENNHVWGWYAQARHPFSRKLDGVLKYEEYMPISEAGKTAFGLGRMQLIRKTAHIGFLYQFDEATRFRLWWQRGLTPYDPSVATGPARSRLGLITGEIQVKY